MTDLNAVSRFADVDKQGMLGHALNLPQTCADAWRLAMHQYPQLSFARDAYRGVKCILIAGMGGSAIGGDLLAALVADECPRPILVKRGYDLPAFVNGPDTLVIASSHSGNTEETLSVFHTARARGALLFALATGGEVARLSREWDVPLLQFQYESQPRAALGYSFFLLIGLLNHLGLISDKANDVAEAIQVMRDWQSEIGPNVPVADNPAKALATRLTGRVPIVYGAGMIEPVAARWKTQFNENAKTWSFYEPMPELNHNAVVGYERSQEVRNWASVLMLHSRYDSSRIQTRWRVTRQMLEQEHVTVETVEARGTSRLAQMLSLIHFGDLVSVYLAIASDVDPTPIGPIAFLKEELAKS